MAYLIQRIAADVLRAIAIEVQEGSLIAVQRWSLEYLQGQLTRSETTEFRILCPKVCFDELGCECKPENCGIAWREPFSIVVAKCEGAAAHQASSYRSCPAYQRSLFQERSSICIALQKTIGLLHC
jgi:hypothetical protein